MPNEAWLFGWFSLARIELSKTRFKTITLPMASKKMR
jgi:hypothetical protein